MGQPVTSGPPLIGKPDGFSSERVTQCYGLFKKITFPGIYPRFIASGPLGMATRIHRCSHFGFMRGFKEDITREGELDCVEQIAGASGGSVQTNAAWGTEIAEELESFQQ